MIYTSDSNSNTVSVIDGSTNEVVQTIPVGLGPLDVAINTNTNMIYTSDSLSDTVSVIDGSTGDVIANVTVGGNPTDFTG